MQQRSAAVNAPSGSVALSTADTNKWKSLSKKLLVDLEGHNKNQRGVTAHS